MARKEENRIFVGGLSSDVSERQLHRAFDRYGKILECQIMVERDTGRPRGFGFITFADRRGMEDAMKEMHGRELGDRAISVNRAQPKMGSDDADHGYRSSYSSGGRGNYRVGDSTGQDDCFKCGRPGHWARDCPMAGGGRGGGGSFLSRPRFEAAGGHGDRLSNERDRYADDRYDGRRYGDGGRYDDRYGSHDRHPSDRYPTNGDRFGSGRNVGSDRYPQNGHGKDRGYDRLGGPRGAAADRYGGGIPARDEGRNYRSSRPGPYDRPSRGAPPSSFDRY
ncbi:unnamed protein product [Lupinus luteus]|uniref:Glycine-rich RNA-binding protein RZ1C n=1 Tax=Lupinus luteus TaxID=3873 RepID=A0AAV1W1Q6_LUPLU